MTDNFDADAEQLNVLFAKKREEIDALDTQLLEILNKRAQCAQVIGEVKSRLGDANMYRPEREAQILRKHKQNNMGPLPDAEIGRLFREIMSACLALEKPLQIAYLGPEGTFTQQAVLKHFGGSTKGIPCRSIDEVFRKVEVGSADYGVVPIENSTEGAVNRTLDVLIDSGLFICGETELRIHQNLITHATELSSIETVYGHPQSLAQCRRWLDQHMPHVKREATTSNARAVELVSENRQLAALGGKNAARTYNVPILFSKIEDETNNTTRFIALGKKLVGRSGEDKTSLFISANDRPGSLFHLIEPFAKYEVMMKRIESRPSKKDLWGYVFFIDIDGHYEDEKVQKALSEIEQVSSQLRILGSYPTGTLKE